MTFLARKMAKHERNLAFRVRKTAKHERNLAFHERKTTKRERNITYLTRNVIKLSRNGVKCSSFDAKEERFGVKGTPFCLKGTEKTIGLQNEKRIKMTKCLFVFILSISTLLSFSQKKPTSIDLYNLGVNYLGKNEFRAADSIFTLALEAGDKNKDTYFDRALARKKLGNTCGFCVDMISAAELGDMEANAVFWKNCPQLDSVFSCITNIHVALKDSQAKVTIFDSAYNIKRIIVIHRTKGLTNRFFIHADGRIDTFNFHDPVYEDPVYELKAIQEQPSFPGGDGELFKFLRENIVYPQYEKQKGIQGKVFVTYVIDKDGSVTNVELYKGIKDGAGLEKEALRVISLMPKWKPGKQNGKYVKVRYILPIFFQLQYQNH